MKLIFILLSLLSLKAWSSAEVCVKNTKSHIDVYIDYVFYGPYAFDKYTKPCIAEANRLFNNPLKIKGYQKKLKYSVSFHITGKTEILGPFPLFSNLNKNPRVNYLRVDKKDEKTPNISFHYLANNGGYLFIDDGIDNNSTTCTHEIAHGLGLNHEENDDLRGEGTPGIMVARGYWVDPQFQYNSEVEAGERGGTVNPKFRRVLEKDIDALNLDHYAHRAVFNFNGCTSLGKANNHILDHQGRIIK